MDPYPVVAYEKEKHEAALHRFLEKVLDAEKFATRKTALSWLNDAHPLRSRSPIRHVVVDGERIAGSMGHMPADYVIDGKRVPVRITHDLLIDPDYRGKGLARLLVDKAREAGEFLPGGMWMNVPCYKIHRGGGFEEMPSPTTQTLVLDTAGFAERQGFNGVKGAAMRVALGVARARALRKAASILKKAGGKESIPEAGAFDPGFDDDWLRMLGTYGIAALRDAEFLNWKYTRHPVLTYRNIVIESKGYLIWRLPLPAAPCDDDSEGPSGAGHAENRAVIVDYLVEKGDGETLERMVSRAIVDSIDARVESLSFMTTQPWAAALLRRFGFLPRRGAHSWVISNWQGRIPAAWLESLEPWHVCLGDSDGDFWTGGQ
jgi:GNAT superfamily N-acetyltransferase